MPPQQPDRLLDLVDDIFDFRAHGLLAGVLHSRDLATARDRGELILERGALLHHALRALLVVPKVGVFGLLVELRQARAGLVEVKDASSAARATA